jgi:hypothetical protein
MRASEVLAAIAAAYPPPRWVMLPELATAPAFDPKRRLDAWVLDTWPSGRLERITFEVKVSRSDYRAEIANPVKRRHGMLLSNRFVFAAPAGLIRVEELPYDCGLLEVTPAGRTVMTVEAPWRDTSPPPWAFVAVIAARTIDPTESRRVGLQAEVNRLNGQVRQGLRELERLTADRDRLQRERRIV